MKKLKTVQIDVKNVFDLISYEYLISFIKFLNF